MQGKRNAVTNDHAAIAHIGRDRYRTELQAGGHSLLADEPGSVGGENTGPSPYDLLAAALGACTVMTLRMYADRKQWPLEGVTVRVTHQKRHTTDCVDCETKATQMDEFSRELWLQGALDEQQQVRLLEIANRCPVHRSLEGEVKVRTKLLATDEAG